MLRKASSINGYAIAASDGPLGTVSDFLFDDTSWLVRWVVVKAGNWLSGRNVLLPPSVLGHLDPKREQFAVRLTMQEVKDSPDIDTQRPVSRQFEYDLYNYYCWGPYWDWGGGPYTGGYGLMGNGYLGGPEYLGRDTAASLSSEARREQNISYTRRRHDDPHLRSIEAVTGYHIHATDGEIGHVGDFLIEDADWSIHYLIVHTKNWWPGKTVLISPRLAREINWSDNLVNLNVDRQRVKDSPTYDPSITVDRAFERNFHKYYANISSTEHRP